ncbi:hypothetical protein CSOJ01_03559 [Colletotrichum sojae]|uniref:Uncharacterized protein n=1 Tax=Colletotrichum sojae TaxID=2175907 RepID=A0A8H6N0S2_9PEZI|nr:hypothetical protein CSOJ01_03559 [Colletotrichum sojae]
MASRAFRLAIAAFLLSILALFFPFELNIKRLQDLFEEKLKIKNKWVVKFQYFFPFGFAVLGVIIIPIMLSDRIKDLKDQGATINPDIAGPGIRFAMWAQEAVLIIIAILGTFHTRANGAREIGGGLVITHLSLAVALLVEMNRKKLTAADAILGSMILDSQNIALSIPLVTKETLASRWQVRVTVACQIFGLVLMAIIVEHFRMGKFSLSPCIRVVWWGRLSNCRSEDSPQEMDVFWVYYACRWLILLQTSFHALWNMSKFDKAEKYRNRHLEKVTFPALVEKAPWSAGRLLGLMRITKPTSGPYDRYPTTVSLMYIVYGVFALASLAATELAMHTFKKQGGHEFFVGQVVAVVVAGVTILRGIWLFVLMCKNYRHRIVLNRERR